MEIVSFYGNILQELCKIYGQQFPKIKNSLRNMRSYKDPKNRNCENVSFQNECDRLAYIFAYGVIHSSAISDLFKDMLKRNRSMMEKIITMKKLRICILGGGPAFEAVSMCKLFGSILAHRKQLAVFWGRPPLQMYITVIDKCIEWEQDAELIINSAQNNLYDAYNVNVHFRFLQGDLTRNFSDNVRKALKTSHFVIIFPCSTVSIYASYSRLEIKDILQRTMESMSYRACLFFQHTAGNFFNKMDRMISGVSQATKIFGSVDFYDCHLGNINSMPAISFTLERTSRFLKRTCQSTFSCSAWLKTRNVVNVKKQHRKTGRMQKDTMHISMEGKMKEKRRKSSMKAVLRYPAKFKELENFSDIDNDWDCSAWLKTRNVVNVKKQHRKTGRMQKYTMYISMGGKMKEKRRKSRMKAILRYPAKFKELANFSDIDDEWDTE